MKKLSIPYQIMVIISVTLAVYYPTLFADISLVDDYDAITYFLSEETFSLKDIFFPHSTGGGYYRPLIMLSYILDKQLWFLHERLMHFESVVAHLVNALLIFCICREAVYLHLRHRETWMPLVAALLFAMHPIMTESVNWISGRTDIMMGTFVLVSVLCLLRYVGTPGKRWGSNLLLLTAITSALIACLAKETAFGYLIGLPLLLIYKANTDSRHQCIGDIIKIRLYLAYYSCAFLSALLMGSYWLVFGIAFLYLSQTAFSEYKTDHAGIPVVVMAKWAAISASVFVTVAGLFFLLRKAVFASSVNKIGQTASLMLADLNYTISLFLGAVGFYVKKFFIPMPLNFFIREVDPLYDFVGIAVLLGLCHLIISRKLPALMSLLGLLLMLPALPFAFGTIAWTAYAERYIYLSSAFWIIALCLWSGNWTEKHPAHKPVVLIMVITLCLTAAGITFNRNMVWQSNVSLMRDTVAQTTHIRKLRNIYIKALLDKGETDEALKQYHLAAVELPSFAGDEQAALMIAGKLATEGRNNAALQLYQDAMQRTQFKSEPLVSASIGLLRVKLAADNISDQELKRFEGMLKKYTDVLKEIKQLKQHSSF